MWCPQAILAELDHNMQIIGYAHCSEGERGHKVRYEGVPVSQQRHQELGREEGLCLAWQRAALRSRESYGYVLTSESRGREEEGMPLLVVASRSLISLGRVSQWPVIQWKDS